MKGKKMLAWLLVLLVCLTANVAWAEGWTCPNCYADSTGNFCSNCGEARPQNSADTSAKGANSLSDVRFTVQDNGDIMVRWDDSAQSPPYELTYTTEDWSYRWYEEDEYGGTNAMLCYLIPGVTYDVTISSAEDEITESYTVPKPIFTEFSTGGKYLTLTETRFSVSDLEDNPTQSFEVRVSWPQLKRNREYTGKLVLKTPYGYASLVYYWDSFTLENRYEYRYMTYAMSEWLDNVESEYGSIPYGEYTFELYLDGQLYDYAHLTLNK